ncbi:MAG: serine/threonine-protein kinase [Planctomycetota bacterium]|nr:serine/threonine-protein kinase [Planctomycetota bacterium]
MNAESLSPDDDSFLDEVFDLSVRSRGTGEALDLDTLLVGREHLREPALRMLDLARDVAVVGLQAPLARDLGVVAGFTVLEEVGRGGMGAVYRARQESLGRIVALKVLAPALLMSARSRERFAMEAEALGRVRHPHVVSVHEVIAQDEVCAYAMEWVDGTTLAKAIAAHDPSLDVVAIARLGVRVAHALTAVHDAGLVHRDVKPSNILLRRDGTPVLSDFGLVRDTEHSMHTATGEFVGTAAYAAPEQLRGQHDNVGAWTDVYGLGATLYAVLSGQAPFVATSTAEMLRRIESGAGTPLQHRNPRVPRDLATIVGKAMDRDPERRYRTAAELAQELERFLTFQPIHARPAGFVLRFQRWLERSPQLAVALAALVVALLVGLGFSIYLSVRLAQERDAAQQAKVAAKHESDIQHVVVDFMRGIFARGDATNSGGRAGMTVREAAELASQCLLAEHRAYEPEVESAIRMAVAEILLSIGLVEPAEKHLIAAMALRRRIYPAEGSEIAATAHFLGRVQRLLGHTADAERSLGEAVRIRRLFRGAGDRLSLAQSLTSLGILLRHQEKFAEAETAYTEALGIYRQGLGENDENVAIVLNTMATLNSLQGRPEEAENKARRSLEILVKFHAGRPHLDVASVGFNLARIRCVNGFREEGERAMQQALEMTRSLVGMTDRASAGQACTLGGQLRASGKIDEAEPLLRAGITAYEALQIRDSADEHGIELADLLAESGRALEAETLLLPILARSLEPKRRERCLLHLGMTKTRLASFADAEADLHQAWSTIGASPGHPDRRAAATAMAALYEAWAAADPGEVRTANAAHWRGVRDDIDKAPSSR